MPDPIHVPVHDDDMVPKLPPSPPTGPENDPDLSKTVHCVAPYKPSMPLVQYALMIDAGSTGSRIHIYKFNNCGQSPMYEYEVFRMTLCARLGVHLRCLVCVAGEATGAGARAWCAFLMCAA